MNKEKVIIVGAGIAGIAAAYFEAKKGNKVTLLETAKEPGGLLRSDFNGKTYFDYGTHILPETGVAEIDDFLFGDFTDEDCLITKKIAAGNYYAGKLNENSCYVNTKSLSEIDYQQCCHELLASRETDSVNLSEFFTHRYGKTLFEKIFKPVIKKYLGEDPDNLDPKIGYFFDMSRVLAFNQDITDKLNRIDDYNKILGHHERKEGVCKYYPRNGGVGALIDRLVRKITSQGVKLITGTEIQTIDLNENNVSSLTTKSGKIDCDRVIWSVPLIFLANLTNISRKSVRPIFRKTTLYDFTFDLPLNTDCTFINVYEPDLYSGRITLYQNLGAEDKGGYSCTVEVLSDEEPSSDIILQELRTMGLISARSNCQFQQLRNVNNGFPVLTCEYSEVSNENNSYYREQFNNVIFIGKASEDAFFMTDVLRDTHKKILKY